jgi:chemotaxis protein CheX
MICDTRGAASDSWTENAEELVGKSCRPFWAEIRRTTLPDGEIRGQIMGDSCAPRRVDCLNPFLTSTLNVFRTMASCELTRGQPSLMKGTQPAHDVSGIIGLTGKAIGTVVLSLDRQVALGVTGAMLGETPLDLNGDVVDAIGELTNIVAGGAKAQLEQFEMSVTMPSVILGRNHTVEFPRDINPIAIPFDSQWGPICVQVGLCEKERNS